jgi:hypothetical protein
LSHLLLSTEEIFGVFHRDGSLGVGVTLEPVKEKKSFVLSDGIYDH